METANMPKLTDQVKYLSDCTWSNQAVPVKGLEMAMIPPTLVAGTLFLTTFSPANDKPTIGTGFMVARPDTYNYTHPEQHTIKQSEGGWAIWIVTAAHNVPDDVRGNVVIETNLPKKGKTSWSVPASEWLKHPQHPRTPGKTNEYDVAVTPPTKQQAPWWIDADPAAWSASMHLSRASMNRHGIVEGDGVFAIGFPSQVGTGVQQNNPIVRRGIIAQVQPYLQGHGDGILIDGAIWGGNSGGPVITQPAVIALEGTKAYSKASLLGMVTGIIHNEYNLNIGMVVPAETINQTIDLFIKNRL